MNKQATKKFEEVCELLDTVQGVVYQLLEEEPSCAEESCETLLNAAISIIESVSNMSPEDQQLIRDLNDKVLAKELTIEEALSMAPTVEVGGQVEEEEDYLPKPKKADKKGKKPLLN